MLVYYDPCTYHTSIANNNYEYYCDTHCLELFLNKQHREVQSLLGLCLSLHITHILYVKVCKHINVGL